MSFGDQVDSVVSVIQMFLVAALGIWLLLRARKTAKFAAVAFLGGGLACYALGDLFFELYYILRGEFPAYFSAADVAWIGGFFFYIAAHWLLDPPPARRSPLPWVLAAVPAAVIAAVIALYGSVVVNLLWAIPLCLLAWCCGAGLDWTRRGGGAEQLRGFYLSLAAYLACELSLFLTWGLVYAIIDAVMTVATLFLGTTLYTKVGKA